MARRLSDPDPIHPGRILFEDFMQPMEISINQLARDLAVPPARVHGIVHGQRAITADTALRLAVYFGMQPQTWIGLQAEYDLRVARLNAWKAISKSVKPRKAA